MKKRSLGRTLLYWVVFILFFTLVPLLLLEGLGRAYIHFKHGKPGKTYGLWQYDKELGAIHSKNGYNTNAETNDYGFRNVEAVIDPKPAGALRLITYGGSIVFCYNLLNHETWSAVLEGHLRKNHHPQDQVLNGGAIVWSLGHLFVRAKRDLPVLKPDYVIIYSGVNEHTNAMLAALEGKVMKDNVERGQYGTIATNLDQSRWSKRNLVLTRFMQYVIAPLLEKQAEATREEIAREKTETAEAPSEPDPYILENYLHVLDDFIELIKVNGGKPVFIIQAYGANPSLNEYLTSYSRKGAELAKEKGAIVLDAREMVHSYEGDAADLFIPSGVHYTKLGAERFGAFIYQQLFEQPSTTSIVE